MSPSPRLGIVDYGLGNLASVAGAVERLGCEPLVSGDASRMIQNDHLSRERGLELASAYDHEFPHTWFQEQLAYLKMTEDEFHEVVDKHRNPEIWMRTDDDWSLRHALPGPTGGDTEGQRGLLVECGFDVTFTNRYVDHDVLCMIAKRDSRSASIPWQGDDYREVIDFFERWHSETETHYR